MAGTAHVAIIDLAPSMRGHGLLFEHVSTGGELYMVTEATR
jgi:hypothetical protein